MKKISMLVLVAFVFVLSACSSSTGITISGSTSVTPLMEDLVAEYKKTNDVEIVVNSDGSSAGIKAAAEGVSDIGMSSRELKDDELNLGLTNQVIALDAIGVIVHPNNKVSGLTLDQITKIFSGQIKNWKEVGGADLPIVLVSREDGSGTRGAFEELVDLLNEDDSSKVDANNPVIGNSTGAVIENVSQKEGAIGYASVGSLEDTVKTIKVDKVLPTEDNILNGTYKIARNFNILTKEVSAEVQKFIDFILSAKGQAIVVDSGYVSKK